ncbi:uncharacterized protein LOC111412593 [Olea europaea var. sylvestris]|uniref:uncharacterized protein LOC111412593 n=1 Tax=Olea europaea var. sylvestris TaxID=158386 RepID=UPI000C1D6FB7|nr:uncharacterized protein LOC111412593 [Olea europaea var. sylvestris]
MVLEEDPFALEIMAVLLPKGFNQTMIEAFDGVTDPLDHLRTFVDLIRLYATPDAVMCRSFPSTLRKEAKDWVATLAPRSIKMFYELSRSFVAYFLSNKRKRKTAIGFSRATLCIKDLQMSAVVTALMNGTRNRAFQMSLSKNPLESMHDLLKEGDKYVNAEEAKKVTKNFRDGWETKAHKRKTNDERRHDDKNKSKNERMNKGYTQDRSVKQKREEVQAPTPLNVPRTKLLMEIQHMKELEWPKPMLTPSSKRNQNKYCHFHKDHGHDTEKCLQLKEKIEHLLGRGLLAKYVKDDRGKQRLDDRPPPRVGVINMIIGDVASGDDSNSARKSYARSVGVCSIQKKARFNQSITFDEEGLIGITHPHDDALVIVGDIADFDVKRVLVDGGSETNVLTWNAFLGLKIPPRS